MKARQFTLGFSNDGQKGAEAHDYLPWPRGVEGGGTDYSAHSACGMSEPRHGQKSGVADMSAAINSRFRRAARRRFLQ